MGPARLHHSNLRLGEVVDHLHQPIFGWNEVGVEDGDELALGELHAVVQSSCFVSGAIRAMNERHRVSHCRVALNYAARHLGGLIRRVIE